LQRAKTELASNREQLTMHEKAYENNVRKIKHATGKLAQVREKIHKYDAELKMSRAEAEMAELAKSFEFDVTTDFGQSKRDHDKISLNRAKARVRRPSGQGIEDIERVENKERSMQKTPARLELNGLDTPQARHSTTKSKNWCVHHRS
jgi:hypothetical protein